MLNPPYPSCGCTVSIQGKLSRRRKTRVTLVTVLTLALSLCTAKFEKMQQSQTSISHVILRVISKRVHLWAENEHVDSEKVSWKEISIPASVRSKMRIFYRYATKFALPKTVFTWTLHQSYWSCTFFELRSFWSFLISISFGLVLRHATDIRRILKRSKGSLLKLAHSLPTCLLQLVLAPWYFTSLGVPLGDKNRDLAVVLVQVTRAAPHRTACQNRSFFEACRF